MPRFGSEGRAENADLWARADAMSAHIWERGPLARQLATLASAVQVISNDVFRPLAISIEQLYVCC